MNLYFVRSKETAKWWDSHLRVTHEVSNGDVIAFGNVSDAQYFVGANRADPLTQKEIDALANEPAKPVVDEVVEIIEVKVDEPVKEPEPELAPPPRRRKLRAVE